ncbi:MAG: DegT/DnrJ/EryC1/StrS family aminotransferase [Streptosporangiaceae bacterium]|nr:DegT/DnrJ/EryC1/StrS family aminotransferase [Streptosporangiaceae bacterium]
MGNHAWGDRPEPINLGQPTFGEEELAAVAAVLDSGWVAGQGPVGRAFEQRFARLCGTTAALALSNCTAALHLGVIGLGAAKGDEVIVADYTFPATGHAVRFAGAEPVFADVRPDIWTVDPAAVEAAITPGTVGIIAVDAFGQPADYRELREIAGRHGLWLLEDAACAAGATYQGRPAGSLADAACFSFHGRKGITCGEGGALTSDNPELLERARKLHFFGIESAFNRTGSTDLPVPVFDELGWNYKMSEIAAAVVSAQLEKLPALVAARRHVAGRYAELLSGADEFALPAELPDRTTVWQSYVLTLAPQVDRGHMATELRARGIQCTIGTYASHLQPVYGSRDECPVSADLFRRHLAIPMHANLTDSQVETVAKAVREVVRQAS